MDDIWMDDVMDLMDFLIWDWVDRNHLVNKRKGGLPLYILLFSIFKNDNH